MRKKIVVILAMLLAIAFVIIIVNHNKRLVINIPDNAEASTIVEILRNSIDDDFFAGVWIDEDQKAVHCHVVFPRWQFPLSSSDRVYWHSAKYSLQQLQEVKDILRSHWEELGIIEITVDVKDNIVNIGVYESSDKAIKKLQDFLPDSRMYRIEYKTDKWVPA